MVLADLGQKIKNALQRLNKEKMIQEGVINAMLKDIELALLQSDVNVKYIKKLKENIIMQFKLEESESIHLRRIIQQAVVKELTQMLEAERKPFTPKRGRQNIVMFVGLQGVGKTTACAKYAYYWQRKGWRTALICADTFRAGAFDQLKQNATKVKVPFYGSYSETDPVQIVEEGVKYFKKENYEIIIIDTSGRHSQETELFDEMKQVQAAVNPDECIFVMDGSIGQACYNQAQAFRNAVNVGSVIITKLDGHAKGGGALSSVAATESPIIFIGTGEHFEDFEPFNASYFIKRLLGLGDIQGIISTVSEAMSTESSSQTLIDFAKDKSSLRLFQRQFSSLLKMGVINKYMSMIPGQGNQVLDKDKDNEKKSIKKIKRFLCIMDSMNDEELDGAVQLNPSRIVRVARGSGTSIEDVNQLLEEYKGLSKILDWFGSCRTQCGPGVPQRTRKLEQITQKISQAHDPNMIKGMGGMGNIINMMKEMSKIDGIRDLMKGLGDVKIAEMMKNLGGSIPGLGGIGGGAAPKKRR